MAVDTRNKRSSAIGVSLPWRGMLPDPDGSVDTEDRPHVVWLYSGIEAVEITVPTVSVIAFVDSGRAMPVLVRGSVSCPVHVQGTISAPVEI